MLLLTITNVFLFAQVNNIQVEDANIQNTAMRYNYISVKKVVNVSNDSIIVYYMPVNSELIEQFVQKKGKHIVFKNIEGLNFAAIKSLTETISNMQNSIDILEKNIELTIQQSADIEELKRKITDMNMVIENLNEKNTELENTIFELKNNN
jgi:3-polyprenyl-4-hydroxybenzoate decarboxylase